MDTILNALKLLSPPGLVLLFMVLLLWLNSWVFNKIRQHQADHSLIRRTITFLLVFVGTLVFILALPIDKGLKGQILSFLGIVISAGIALSSTTLLGNLIAGLMNNSMNRFQHGDLIDIGDLQGRITKKNIFHTEIQLEDSNFVTIPNLYIASHPVKLTRKTNTVIACSVSLGYDVPRSQIESCLKEAALATGLKDPYVYIMELGDFSVVYKTHGFLEDSSKFFSTTSQFKGKVMDALHARGIEIVSPSFMNQRTADGQQFVPKPVHEPTAAAAADEIHPEELIFDKAIKSEAIEKKKLYLKEIETRKEQYKEQLKQTAEAAAKERIKRALLRLEEMKENIEKSIEEQNKQIDEEPL